MLKLILLPALCLSLLHGRMHATIYYVSANGNDANDGSKPTSAWRSLQPTMNVDFAPGDSLLLYGGDSFSGRIYLDERDAHNPAVPFVISTYGPSVRATINAEDGFGIYVYNTCGIRIENLTLLGSGVNKNTKAGVELYVDVAGDVKHKNIVLKNLEVSGFGQTGVRIGAWQGNSGFADVLLEDLDVHDNRSDGIQVYGFFSTIGYPHANVTIRRCKAYRNTGYADPSAIRGSGIVVGNTDGVLIEHCVAYENGRDNIHCGGPGGIWVFDANAAVIQFCESYQNATNSACDGLGFDLDGGTTNSVIQYCYSHDNAGGGYLLGQYDGARPWLNNTCRYNISVNDGRSNAGAITVFKGGTTTIIRDVHIYNNTVYVTPTPTNPEVAAVCITQWNTGIENVHILNNVLITTEAVPHVRVPAGYEARIVGNVYWNASSPVSIDYQGSVYHDLQAFRESTSNERVDGKSTGWIGDPRLSGVGFSEALWPAAPETIPAYAISSSKSHAFQGGVDVAAILGVDVGRRDLAGNAIPGHGKYDVGAIEFTGDTTDSWMNDTTTNGGTSVSDASGLDRFNVYPNPARDALIISGYPVTKGSTMAITSSIGDEVVRCTVATELSSMDIRGLLPGMYTIRILDVTGTIKAHHVFVVVE